MSRVAPAIPEETALLCEGCGYILNGLPHNSVCPECGKPIVYSLPNTRRFTPWDRNCDPVGDRFWRTTWKVIFHPGHFYRTLRTRCPKRLSGTFARIHLAVSSLLFAAAATAHVVGYIGLWHLSRWDFISASVGLALATFFFLVWLTRLAARLTAWEAGYRGLRLPHAVVLRGLDYHAAHYLPVSILAAVTVVGERTLLFMGYLRFRSDTPYLVFLCTEIVGCAIYLFITYWIGMKNMMYANA